MNGREPETTTSPEFADRFAAEWIEAWNSHDLDRILSHYADDFSFSSPLIRATVGEASGCLQGKDAIRAYWGKALALRPNLRFELVQRFVGVGSLVIHYRNQEGRLAAEHFEFGPDGKVARSAAHYG